MKKILSMPNNGLTNAIEEFNNYFEDNQAEFLVKELYMAYLKTNDAIDISPNDRADRFFEIDLLMQLVRATQNTKVELCMN